MSSEIITRSDFEKHHFLGDCWIAIDGNVYDVSQWMNKHPGGQRLLECLGGKDATLPFLLNHKPWIREKYLKSMFVGVLETKKVPNKYDALTADFMVLYKELVKKGWFETSYAYYTKKMMVLASMLCGAMYLFHLSRYYDLQIFAWIGSFIVGMFWQQIAFIGHDVGHNAITHSVFCDSIIGLFIGNLGQGISMGWWKYTHNIHHVRTNDVVWDPDIQHMPVVAISKQYLNGLWSHFHRKKLPPTDYITAMIAKICIKFQHFHWFFSIALSRCFVYLSSIIFVFYQQPNNLNGRTEPWPYQYRAEQITLILYHVWTISLFYFCTDSPAFYYFIAYCIAGILHIQIIMNHFPCPIFEDLEEENFVVHQLRSSMAVKSTIFSHWFYGGLQFQVEHHLFPMMPRHNLRKVKPYILELCRKYDIEYLENSFWGACVDIFYILRDVAKHADTLNDIKFELKAN